MNDQIKKPLYVLAVAPTQPSKIKGIFEGGEGTVMELLRNPGELRSSGWDLRTLDTPRIIKGEYLEVRNGDRKVLTLYEDGTFIFRAFADETFLGHGPRESSFEQDPRLNPLALIEVTYNFVDLYRRIAKYFVVPPDALRFVVELKNLYINEESKIYMTPYAVSTWAWVTKGNPFVVPEENMKRELSISFDYLAINPARVAYDIIEKVYTWFGMTTDQIPYVKSEEQKRSIDVEKISNS